ncbi:MAG: type transport system permease protein [Actinomycetota bacterium]
MARHLAALKFALLRGGLRRGGRGSVIALVITLIGAVFGGGALALSLLSMRTILPSTACDIAAVVFALLAAGWAFGPVLALASDSTIDIDRLALFPLTARQLMPGLLLSAVIGVGGVFSIIVLLGAFLGMSATGPSAVVALVAVVLELVLCLSLSRWVSTSLSVAASKRRWRDVALFAGPVLALAINLGVQAANRAVFVNDRANHQLRTHSRPLAIARHVVRWLPTGWSTVAVHAARTGNYALAFLGLFATATFALGLTALWWRAIQRATTTTVSPGAPHRGGRSALIPRFVGWLPHNALGAIAAKELRYTWREPRRRAALLGLLFAGVLPLLVFRSLAASNPRTCFIAVWPALNIGMNANAFGFDGDRLWVDVAAGVSVADELRARTLARVIGAVPVVLVLVAALAALARSAAGVVPALGAVAAAVGMGFAFAAILSVRTPFPMADAARGNAFGGAGTGQNASAGFAALGAVVVSGLVVAPLILVSTKLPLTSPLQTVLAAIGVGIGVVAWRIGLAVATSRDRADGAELLARLTRA